MFPFQSIQPRPQFRTQRNCILALGGLALGLMSRLILNVSIVEMVKRVEVVPGEDLVHETTTLPSALTTLLGDGDHFTTQASTTKPTDPLIYAATYQATASSPATTQVSHGAQSLPFAAIDSATGDKTSPSNESLTTTPASESTDSDDGLHFNWSKQDVQIILGSFYIGYGPGILFSGSVAQRYGAKYPLFLCVFGSAIINIFTPMIAQLHLNLLIGSRIMLGVIQGSLMPCLYELFNRWLTQTESSIFAPMIKVSMPLGSLLGTIMPGILASFKLDWPNLFYIGGCLCLAWSLAWALLATSLPQTNRFVGVCELNRIMRKKRNHFSQPATITDKYRRPSGDAGPRGTIAGSQARKPSTPWMRIVTNPSVLALTTVKFTYNIGMDFIVLQLAVYLREVHNAPMETISKIASAGYLMQMLLISFVGWLAKVLVISRACGLSVTKWRKIFQGGSNLLMALTYLVLAYTSPSLETTTILLLSVCFWWMLGAGGESMLPYDLSSEYPASIVGFAHSISIFSGVALTTICEVVLGENTEDSERWSCLFYLLAGMLAFGGTIFVIMVKAKPFLPGERVPKSTRLTAIKLRGQQQKVPPISMVSDHTKHNKMVIMR